MHIFNEFVFLKIVEFQSHHDSLAWLTTCKRTRKILNDYFPGIFSIPYDGDLILHLTKAMEKVDQKTIDYILWKQPIFETHYAIGFANSRTKKLEMDVVDYTPFQTALCHFIDHGKFENITQIFDYISNYHQVLSHREMLLFLLISDRVELFEYFTTKFNISKYFWHYGIYSKACEVHAQKCLDYALLVDPITDKEEKENLFNHSCTFGFLYGVKLFSEKSSIISNITVFRMIMNNEIEILSYLMKNGIFHHSESDCLVLSRDNQAMFQLFVDHGVNLTKFGEAAFLQACTNRWEHILSYFIGKFDLFIHKSLWIEYACLFGDFQLLEQLLEPDCISTEFLNQICAAPQGHLVVKFLIFKNIISPEKCFKEAVQEGYAAIVECFLQNLKIYPILPKISPLALACATYTDNQTLTLLAEHEDVNNMNGRALVYACRIESIRNIEFLLSKFENQKNQPMALQKKLFQILCRKGNFLLFNRLVLAGMDYTPYKNQLFAMAIQYGHWQFIKALKGAKVHKRLTFSCKKAKQGPILKYLLSEKLLFVN